jgi:hypothetical protein
MGASSRLRDVIVWRHLVRKGSLAASSISCDGSGTGRIIFPGYALHFARGRGVLIEYGDGRAAAAKQKGWPLGCRWSPCSRWMAGRRRKVGIRTKQDHRAALARLDELMNAEAGTPEGAELEALAILVERYEREAFPINLPDRTDLLEFIAEQRGQNRA